MKITTIRLNNSLEKISNKFIKKYGHTWYFNINDLDIVIKKPLNYSKYSIWEVKNNYKEITEKLLEEYNINCV